MSSPGNLSVQPPSPPHTPPISAGATVRRHHTISASSRAARKDQHTEEDQQAPDQEHWQDDEPVDQDWVGGVGAVGEKSLLHRQSSLPTKYHRGKPIPSISDSFRSHDSLPR
jgi:hypothetical protein